MIAPEFFAAPSATTHPRIGREAARRRRLHTRNMRYINFIRIGSLLSIGVVIVTAYLCVVAHMSATNVALNTTLEERAQLQEETLRLDDQVAKALSRERLYALASSMKMNRSEKLVIVTLPVRAANASRQTGAVALFSSVSNWLHNF